MTSPVSQPASSEARKTAARHVLGLAEAARGRIREGARDVTVEWRLEPSGVQQGVPVGAAILDVAWAAD